MYTTNLRRVGGSIMMTIPPVLLDLLHLEPSATVSLEIKDDCLIVQRQRPCYTVEELLVGYDASFPLTEEEREWLDAPRVGRELI